MNRTKLFILALAGIFAVSCATDNVDNTASTSVDAALLKKFVNTPEEAIKGELYVNEAKIDGIYKSKHLAEYLERGIVK